MTTGRGSVLIDIRKYDGGLSALWTATRLGEDVHGIWLGTARGVHVGSATGGWTTRFPYVMVVPRDAWWTATFCAAPGPEMYCDVCTVPEWNADGTVLTMVDLDLDVVRPQGGDACLQDEDEFDQHRVLYGYSDDTVDEARRTCAWLMEAGRRGGEGAEPFASAYRHWLGLMRE
ncbi:DUF402 domain-containing protein [Streptomyces sp. NPDC058653]|uniref:DUF402 domain-containing protein n=1 Tax=Streptomyces sp. NPDC058653 TaxID=3346576 RepID=UPI0036483DB2